MRKSVSGGREWNPVIQNGRKTEYLRDILAKKIKKIIKQHWNKINIKIWITFKHRAWYCTVAISLASRSKSPKHNKHSHRQTSTLITQRLINSKLHIDQTMTEGSHYRHRTATNIPMHLVSKSSLKVQNQTENTPSLFNIHTHSLTLTNSLCACVHISSKLHY